MWRKYACPPLGDAVSPNKAAWLLKNRLKPSPCTLPSKRMYVSLICNVWMYINPIIIVENYKLTKSQEFKFVISRKFILVIWGATLFVSHCMTAWMRWRHLGRRHDNCNKIAWNIWLYRGIHVQILLFTKGWKGLIQLDLIGLEDWLKVTSTNPCKDHFNWSTWRYFCKSWT